MNTTHLSKPVVKLLDIDVADQIFAIELHAHQAPWSKAKIDACFNNPLVQIFGCYVQQKLLGYAVLQIVEPEAELQNFAITPAAQRQGIGNFFLNALIRHCRNSGLAKIMLEVRKSNEVAINLYRAAGFKQVGRRADYYPTNFGREAALLFTLELC